MGLRVRVKELAQEARFIKHEETRIKNRPVRGLVSQMQLRTLQEHRKMEVRPAARQAQLAYAYLKGRPYKSIEYSTKNKIDFETIKQVARLANKFGNLENSFEDVKIWLTS
jgi:hypothetical protein